MPLVLVGKLIDPVLIPQYLVFALCLAGAAVMGNLDKASPTMEFPKWPLLTLLGMVGMFALSLIHSLNLSTGLFELLRWFSMGGIFLAFSWMLKSQSGFKSVVGKTLVVTTLVQASIGQFKWLPFVEVYTRDSYLIGAHTNSNLYGLAFLLVIPFLIQTAFLLKREWRYATVLATLVALWMVYQSGSRSSSLAILIGSGMLLPMVFIHLHKNGVEAKWKGLAVALLLALIAGAWYGNKKTFVKKVGSKNFDLILAENPSLPQYAPSLDHRMVLWNKTIRMWEDHFLLGVGLGNWKFHIQEYGFQAADDKGNYGLDIPQRPHNIFLQIASESGVLALLAYLILIGMAIWASLKQALRKEREIFIQGMCLLVFWVGYLISTTFNFPLERPFHVAVILYGLALSFSHAKSSMKISAGFTSIAGLLVASLLVVFCVFKIQGELAFKSVKIMKAKQNWAGVMQATKEGGNWFTPVDPEGGAPMAWYGGIAALSTGGQEEGLTQMKAAAEIAPHHLAVRSNLAAAYNLNQMLPEAADAYAALLETFPDFEDARLNLALTFAQMGKYREAEQELNKIVYMKESPRYLTLYNQLQSLPK